MAHWTRAVTLDPSEYETLLGFALSLTRSGKADLARPYIQLFADGAPPAQYAAQIARAREWLSSERR
jgi:hypothetical protein